MDMLEVWVLPGITLDWNICMLLWNKVTYFLVNVYQVFDNLMKNPLILVDNLKFHLSLNQESLIQFQGGISFTAKSCRAWGPD